MVIIFQIRMEYQGLVLLSMINTGIKRIDCMISDWINDRFNDTRLMIKLYERNA